MYKLFYDIESRLILTNIKIIVYHVLFDEWNLWIFIFLNVYSHVDTRLSAIIQVKGDDNGLVRMITFKRDINFQVLFNL